MPVLYLIVCGAPPARNIAAFVPDLIGDGWDVCVIATPEGSRFFDLAQVAALSAHSVRTRYKDPDAPDELPPADAVAVVPATFNTINKFAAGIADTLALGLLCELLGHGLPIVVVPWAKAALRSHPAFGASVNLLSGLGVRFVVAAGESGRELAWERVRHELRGLRPRS